MAQKSDQALRQFVERDKWLHTAVEREQAEWNAAWRLGWLEKRSRAGWKPGALEPMYEYRITEAGREMIERWSETDA